MRILIVSQYFYPEQFRVNDICKELVETGHTVTVLTGLPNYPNGEIYSGYADAYQKIDNYFGAVVYRCKLRPRRKGAKNLALNYLSFMIEASKTIKEINPNFDVIYVYGLSPITVAIPAILYKKRYNIPIYYYCLDVWPDCVRDANNGHKELSKNNIIYFAAKMISKYVYKNVDVIANKCDEFGDYIHSVCKVPYKKMKTLFEHAEESYLSIPNIPKDNGIVDFMFLGNIGEVQNCDLLVEAFGRIEDKENIKFHFVGDGSAVQKVKSKVSELNLENKVVFHGKQPIEKINEYYELADVCVLALSSGTASGLTPPGKLISYMAAARPVIAAVIGSGKTIVEESKCGFCVFPDDIEGISYMMQKCVYEKDSLVSLGTNAREYFLKNFTLDRHMKFLTEQLNELLKNNME